MLVYTIKSFNDDLHKFCINVMKFALQTVALKSK